MAHLNKLLKYKNIVTGFNIQNRYSSQNLSAEWKNAKPFNAIPAYSKWKFFRAFLPGGELHNRNLNEILSKMRKQFGNITYTPAIFGTSRVVAYVPDDFEKIFRNDGPAPRRHIFDSIKEHRRNRRKDYYQGTLGTLVANDEEWSKFRSTVNPVLMQQKAMKNYFNRVSNVTDEFIEKIKEIRDPNTLEVPDNFLEQISRWALENISSISLDKPLNFLNSQGKESEEAKELFESITIFFDEFTNLDIKPPIWKIIETPTFKKVMNSLDYITFFVDKHIKESIERIESDKGRNLPDEEKGILELLWKVDKKVATVMIIDMFFGGVNSIAASFTGILLCLSKYPEKQEKLRVEIFNVLQNKDSDFTADNTKDMPFLRACIKESRRFYPSSPGMQRCTSKDMVLSGYQIPKGTEILLINEFLLKDANYFPKPYEFLPERWMRETDDGFVGKTSNPFVYIPFGFGSRSCVGQRVAELELEIGVMKIVKNFEVQFNYPTENLFKKKFIYMPDKPLNFKFIDL